MHEFVVVLQMVPMATIADWIKSQTADAKTVVVAVFSVIILIGAASRMVKSHFSFGSMLIAGVVAALAGWLVLGDGISTLQTMFGEQGKSGT